MKTGRVVVSLIGLVAIILTYVFQNLYFLIVAIVAFAVGLFMMGALRRLSQRKSQQQREEEGKRGFS
ncbi:MAG: hypothetical protein ACREBS_08935, partial [Nitrososphaerales archaeon]